MKTFIAAYKNNEDLHRVTAKIFELEDGEEVSREQRIIAKTINFSIIYGRQHLDYLKNWELLKRS